jgi:hypothetical protein
MASYGYQAQPVDYSFIAQAGTTLASGLEKLPAMQAAIEKKKLLDENIKKLKLRKDQAEEVRKQRVDEALNEYKAKMGITDDAMNERLKAKIEATFWPSVLIGDNVDNGLKLMSDNDTKFATWLNNQALEKAKNEAAKAAANVTSGISRQYSPEKTVTSNGQEFTEQNITEQSQPPAKYQEEAISRYGTLAAQGQAPILPKKELLEQPSIAALPVTPKKPEDDPLFNLKKQNYELRNKTEMAREAAFRASAARQNKNDQVKEGEQVDKAIKTVVDQRFSLDRSIRDDSKLIGTLNTAIKKMENNTWNSSDMQSLYDVGISGNISSPAALKDLLITTQKEQLQKKADLAELKRTEKNLIKNSSTPLTKSMSQTKQDVDTEAINYLQTNVAPTISTMTGSVSQVIDKMPQEYKSTIQAKVNELKQAAASQNIILSDNDILQMLLAKRK